MIQKKDNIKKKTIDLPVRGDTSSLAKKQKDSVNRSFIRNCKIEDKNAKIIYNLIKYPILFFIIFYILGVVIRIITTGTFNVGQLVSLLSGCFVACLTLIMVKRVFASVLTTNNSQNAKKMQEAVICEIEGVSRQDFLDRMQKVVIPKLMAQKTKQKNSHSNCFLGICITFLILLGLVLCYILSLLVFRSGALAAIITFLAFILFGVICNSRYEASWQQIWTLLEKEIYGSLYLQKIKFDKSDAKAFFNEIQFFEPPLKNKVHLYDELNFSFDNGKINVYTGYFNKSNNRHDNMDMFLFEIPTKNFYKAPVVFTLGNKEGFSVIDFGSIDDVNAAFTVRGDKENIRYLKKKGICEKLVNIGNAEFNDDCIWCIHASFYHDKLYIAFDVEYSLLSDLEDGYNKIKSYEWFYDNVAAIEKYCQQFQDV